MLNSGCCKKCTRGILISAAALVALHTEASVLLTCLLLMAASAAVAAGSLHNSLLKTCSAAVPYFVTPQIQIDLRRLNPGNIPGCRRGQGCLRGFTRLLNVS